MEKDNIKHKASKLAVEVGVKINEESFKEVERRFKKLLDMSIQINKLRKENGLKPIEGGDEVLIPKSAYEVFTKDKYIEYRLCGMNPWDVSKETIKALHEQWDKRRKGYEFVILAGGMTYSVDYFNTVVLGGSRKQCISKEDILLGNISIEEFKEEILYSDNGIEQITFSKEDEC